MCDLLDGFVDWMCKSIKDNPSYHRHVACARLTVLRSGSTSRPTRRVPGSPAPDSCLEEATGSLCFSLSSHHTYAGFVAFVKTEAKPSNVKSLPRLIVWLLVTFYLRNRAGLFEHGLLCTASGSSANNDWISLLSISC